MFMHANYEEENKLYCYCFGKMTLCLNPLWTSRFKVILRRSGWYNSAWKGSYRL